jgi:hypothetical protein
VIFQKDFPIEERLQLKIGAQVMFVKNDLSFETSMVKWELLNL